ncbi:CDP-diacylglycerol--serine O-phosphatidyltransferase [Pseudoalteromonas sp. SSM20]|uniref:CDP-diacylglycerol--serine O-phosphatidyltransferase n=1 Tax=Pseudoalteromonas sp. SSM20 TaxID=3139394 RepID=UPI003BAA0915
MDFWQKEPSFKLESEQISILLDAASYRAQLLSLIKAAQKRIVITALYLQDDKAGREILTALHEASNTNPNLRVDILVDYHRAQRGLIGEATSEGNAALYLKEHQTHQNNVRVFGVPVKGKEVFGVLHLKGMVIDDTVLYSGASLNNVYLQYQDRYRLDRYFTIQNNALANAFTQFIDDELIASKAVIRLDQRPIKKLAECKSDHKALMKSLKRAKYPSNNTSQIGAIDSFLFLGFGRRGNMLNRAIKNLFELGEKELVLYTPYFNFPAPLLRVLRKKLKQGLKVTIVVGDKTANDFYISPDKPFSKIGALPYLYETILAKFLKLNDTYVQAGLLNVHLWRHETNSFHLKGISVDNRYQMMTGHNLNPRAWGLDIENGILFDDSQGLLTEQLEQEKQQILSHCTKLNSYKELETMADYPEPVAKLLGQAKRVKVDFIIKRFI